MRGCSPTGPETVLIRSQVFIYLWLNPIQDHFVDQLCDGGDKTYPPVILGIGQVA